MAKVWFYKKDGVRHGPVASAELRELAKAGVLLPSDPVWKDGMKQAVRAGKVRGLFSRPNNAPESAGGGHGEQPQSSPVTKDAPQPLNQISALLQAIGLLVHRSRAHVASVSRVAALEAEKRTLTLLVLPTHYSSLADVYLAGQHPVLQQFGEQVDALRDTHSHSPPSPPNESHADVIPGLRQRLSESAQAVTSRASGMVAQHEVRRRKAELGRSLYEATTSDDVTREIRALIEHAIQRVGQLDTELSRLSNSPTANPKAAMRRKSGAGTAAHMERGPTDTIPVRSQQGPSPRSPLYIHLRYSCLALGIALAGVGVTVFVPSLLRNAHQHLKRPLGERQTVPTNATKAAESSLAAIGLARTKANASSEAGYASGAQVRHIRAPWHILKDARVYKSSSAVSFSADSSRMAVRGPQSLSLFDIGTGTCTYLGTLDCGKVGAVSPNGTLIATVGTTARDPNGENFQPLTVNIFGVDGDKFTPKSQCVLNMCANRRGSDRVTVTWSDDSQCIVVTQGEGANDKMDVNSRGVFIAGECLSIAHDFAKSFPLVIDSTILPGLSYEHCPLYGGNSGFVPGTTVFVVPIRDGRGFKKTMAFDARTGRVAGTGSEENMVSAWAEERRARFDVACFNRGPVQVSDMGPLGSDEKPAEHKIGYVAHRDSYQAIARGDAVAICGVADGMDREAACSPDGQIIVSSVNGRRREEHGIEIWRVKDGEAVPLALVHAAECLEPVGSEGAPEIPQYFSITKQEEAEGWYLCDKEGIAPPVTHAIYLRLEEGMDVNKVQDQIGGLPHKAWSSGWQDANDERGGRTEDIVWLLAGEKAGAVVRLVFHKRAGNPFGQLVRKEQHGW